MKKIFLIDDNSGNQRQAFGASFVDENIYSDCLEHKEKLNGKSDLSFLNDAACIMIHSTFEDFIDGSFHPDSHNARRRIDDEILQDKKIPQVIFSDGFSIEPDFKEDDPDLVKMKKSVFYSHLRFFLDEYRKSGLVNLEIIAYGKDYVKRRADRYYSRIRKKLSNCEDCRTLEQIDIDIKSLSSFIDLAQPRIGCDLNDIMSEVEDREYTVADFKMRIDKIYTSIKNYGKNIISW